MLSLELVKARLAVMSMEMRKNFIQAILTSLIEKSPDAKILRAVVKIVEEWVKNNSPMAANQVSWGGHSVVSLPESSGFTLLPQLSSETSQVKLFPHICIPVCFLKMNFSHCAHQILNRNLK